MTRKATATTAGAVFLAGCLLAVLRVSSLASTLVFPEEAGSGEAILIDNFDPEYRLFERAATLQAAGIASRVLVPTEASGHDPDVANAVSKGIAELMAHLARVQNPEFIPIREIEPYTLNAA